MPRPGGGGGGGGSGGGVSSVLPGSNVNVTGPAATPTVAVKNEPSFTSLRVIPIQPTAPTRTVIYVRTGGNDTTGDGLTVGTAYRTIQKALDMIPTTDATRRYVVDCTGLNDALSLPIHVPPYISDAAPIANITGPEFPLFTSEGGYVTVQAVPTVNTVIASASQTIDTTSTMLTLTVSPSPGWTVDQWKGKILGGSGFDESTIVISNTANTITVGANFGGTLSAPFTIYDHGATLTRTNSIFYFKNTNAAFQINGIKLASSNAAILAPRVQHLTTMLCDVRGFNISEGDIVLFNTSYIHAAGSPAHGLCCVSGQFQVWGYMEGIYADWKCNVTLNSLGIKNCTISTFPQPSYFRTQNTYVLRGFYLDVQGTGLTFDTPTNHLVSVSKFTNISGNPITVRSGAKVTLGLPITGSAGNTGYGVRVEDGGLVEIADPTTTLAVSGALGDMKVGQLPVRTWTHYQSSAPLYNEHDLTGGGARIFNHYTGLTPGKAWPVLPEFATVNLPLSPAEGTQVVDTTTNELKTWINGAWRAAGATTVSAGKNIEVTSGPTVAMSTDPTKLHSVGMENYFGGRIKIYVRTGGNDTTGNGLTAGTAYRTITRALEDVPTIRLSGTRYVIDITGINDTLASPIQIPEFVSDQGLTTLTSGADWTWFISEGYVTIQAVPTSVTTITTAEMVPSPTIDPNSGTIAITCLPSRGWTTDQYKGKPITGSVVGEYAMIIGNTADTLYVQATFGTPLTGDVTIWDYGASLAHGSLCSISVKDSCAPFAMNGVRLHTLGYVNGQALCAYRAGRLYFGVCDIFHPYIEQADHTNFDTCYLHGDAGATTIDFFIRSRFFIASGFWEDLRPMIRGENAELSGIGLRNCLMQDASSLVQSPDTAALRIFNADIQVRGLTFRFGVVARVSLATFTNVTVGDCILVEDGARLFLRNTVGGSAGNTGFGLRAKSGGYVGVFPSTPGSYPSLSGAGGDMKVGLLPTRSWTDFSTGAQKPYIEHDAFGDGSIAEDPGNADSATSGARTDKTIAVGGVVANSATAWQVADPGNAGAISVTSSGVCALTSAGAETRTLAAPSFVGQKLALICDTYVGSIVVTVASSIDQAGDTLLTFGAAADMIELTCMTVGGVKVWRATANDGVALA